MKQRVPYNPTLPSVPVLKPGTLEFVLWLRRLQLKGGKPRA